METEPRGLVPKAGNRAAASESPEQGRQGQSVVPKAENTAIIVKTRVGAQKLGPVQ